MNAFGLLLFVAVFGLTSLTSTNALGYSPKEGNVNATVGTYIFKTNFEDTSSGVKSPYLGGLAIVATGDSNQKGALELSVFHMNKLFMREYEGMHLVEGVKSIQINMGYRWYLSDKFSTSVSFYSAYPMGEPFVVHREMPANVFVDTSARDLTEYGFDFAFQYELITYEKDYALILDGRYSWSVTPKANEKGDQYGLLLAVRFLVQSSGPRPGDRNPESREF